MAIQINGNGTITGISVGGLPDGIVDTDMIAANAIATAKIADDAVTPAKSTISSKILQVVHGSTTTFYQTTSSTMSDIGLSASITPSSSSNKILVFGNIGGIETSGDNYGGGELLRDSTVIIADVDRGIGFTGDSTRQGTNSPFSILDSPNSTSSLTYKVRFRIPAGGGNITCQTNGSRSAITLMEISV